VLRRRGWRAQHRHGAGQHHKRRGASFVGDRDHPILAGLRRMLAQAIGETHGMPIRGLEPRKLDASFVPHRTRRRLKMEIVVELGSIAAVQ
jgi:hypothetical protein